MKTSSARNTGCNTSSRATGSSSPPWGLTTMLGEYARYCYHNSFSNVFLHPKINCLIKVLKPITVLHYWGNNKISRTAWSMYRIYKIILHFLLKEVAHFIFLNCMAWFSLAICIEYSFLNENIWNMIFVLHFIGKMIKIDNVQINK